MTRKVFQKVQGALSQHAKIRMQERDISMFAVQECMMHGTWMKNPHSGRTVLSLNGVLLGVKPFSKAIPTVMSGTASGYERFFPRKKEKTKYCDTKHIVKFYE